jgi:hypothetical protein
MHSCYLPENRSKLEELRKIEAKQRRGIRLTWGQVQRIIELKRLLRIGY